MKKTFLQLFMLCGLTTALFTPSAAAYAAGTGSNTNALPERVMADAICQSVTDITDNMDFEAMAEEARRANLTPAELVIEDATKNNVPNEYHLTKRAGIFYGPSGKETYYNLPMSGVINDMRRRGYNEDEYPYWVRDDGVKMFGPYIMVSADLGIRPKGTIIECSLGTAIVCDTGSVHKSNPTLLDIAVDWR